jgi:hypothetical protein
MWMKASDQQRSKNVHSVGVELAVGWLCWDDVDEARSTRRDRDFYCDARSREHGHYFILLERGTFHCF